MSLLISSETNAMTGVAGADPRPMTLLTSAYSTDHHFQLSLTALSMLSALVHTVHTI